MRSFLKWILIFLIPLYIVIISYFIIDPFKVLYRYDDYSVGSFLQLNRDFVSTQTFLNKNSKYHYDSFLFGSSRTVGFRISTWMKFLPKNSIPFSFDASNESVYGIERKLNFLNETKVPINNVIILICGDVFFNTVKEGENYLYEKHPILTGGRQFLFQLKFFKAFLKKGFFIRVIDYDLFSVHRKYMDGYLDFRGINFDSINNNMYLNQADDEIKEDSINYYLKRQSIFYKRSNVGNIYPPKIGPDQLRLLNHIKSIFDSNFTDFKLVVSPLYNQTIINPKDISILVSIFGQENIYNFSGINKFTDDPSNFYESSHFRYKIGNQILDSIYLSHKRSVISNK